MSTIHDDIAKALISVLEGQSIKAYKWSPGAIKPPCAVIEMPTIHRTEVDHREDHVGADDWRLDYPIAFYTELARDVTKGQASLAQNVVNFIRAIDTLTPTEGLILNGLCIDAKVTQSVPFVEAAVQDESRTLIGYETHVSILTFQ
jgi:hypothetical protein